MHLIKYIIIKPPMLCEFFTPVYLRNILKAKKFILK